MVAILKGGGDPPTPLKETLYMQIKKPKGQAKVDGKIAFETVIIRYNVVHV